MGIEMFGIAKKQGGNRPKYLPRIDVLRALAALGVFFSHFLAQNEALRHQWHNSYFSDMGAWSPIAYPLLVLSWGWLGVPLFFVLSGFCIHYSFLKAPDSFSVGSFYWHRLLRIYPAYFVNMVFCLILIGLGLLDSRYANIWQIPSHLFLLHNLFKFTFFGINSVYWTLGLEAQFYLFYPLLIVSRRSWGLKKCLVAALGLNLLFATYFFSTRHVIDGPASVDWSFPLVTWFDWILGAAVAEAYMNGTTLFNQSILFFPLITALLLLSLNFKPLSPETFLIASLFFSVILEVYINWRAKPQMWEQILIPIGTISYSLYLWHLPLMNLIYSLGKQFHIVNSPFNQALIYFSVVLAIALSISYWSYYYIERAVPRLAINLPVAMSVAWNHLIRAPLKARMAHASSYLTRDLFRSRNQNQIL